ncbi:hypothetical protein HDU88_007036 [Geranomyces variabilis]|nr:hypothetical protein HDU88_007036 [Geranomyces variabilis]
MPSDSSTSLQPPSFSMEDRLEDSDLAQLERASQVDRAAASYHLLPTAALLAAFSVVGTLVRIGLLELHNYPDAPVISIIYPQLVGCVIIGWINVYKNSVSKRYHPIYVAIATGLCGSITTFSTWSLDTFLALSSTGSAHRSWNGDNILAGIAITIVVLSVSLSSLSFGETIALLPTTSTMHTPPAPRPWLQLRFEPADVAAMVVGSSVWTCAVALTFAVSEWRNVMAAAAMGPFGTVLRWRLSLLNLRYLNFPLGTFLANMLGTLCIGILYLLSHRAHAGTNVCILLNALSTGFCGCLTTVSTFVVELTSLPKAAAWTYGVASIAGGLTLLAVVLGGIASEITDGACVT